MTEIAKAMDEAELRVTGIEALNKALGPAQALISLALFHRGQMDYLDLQEALRRSKRRGCLQEGQGTLDWLRVWLLHFSKIAPIMLFHPRLLLDPGPERAYLVAELQQLCEAEKFGAILDRVEARLPAQGAAKVSKPARALEGAPLHSA